jgi:hypothetical protein
VANAGKLRKCGAERSKVEGEEGAVAAVVPHNLIRANWLMVLMGWR